jgi:glutaredoxin
VQLKQSGWQWLAWLALSCLLGLAALGARAAAPADAQNVTVEYFGREGCPHCAKAEEFLAELGKEQPQLRIVKRDVQKEPAAMDRLAQLVQENKAGMARVPAIFAGGQLFIGFSEEIRTDKLIRGALAGQRAQTTSVAEASACDAEESLSCPSSGHTNAGANVGAAPAAPAPENFEVNFFGRTLTLDDVGLPAFSLAMGVLDGFNPCSMWVLLLMISILAPLNDRRRMLAIAGTFVLVQGIAYFIFMAAWLNLFLLIGMSRGSQLVIAAIALLAGFINVKDFFAFGRGISLSIPERAKPGIYQRIRGLLHAPTLTAAIVGAIVLAVLVQIVEFLCTSGFPALFTRILTLRELETSSYYGYMLLYIAAYMFDDVVVLGTGVILLSRHRLQEKEGRWLKLISGLVMIGLGVYLVLGG